MQNELVYNAIIQRCGYCKRTECTRYVVYESAQSFIDEDSLETEYEEQIYQAYPAIEVEYER